MQASLLGPLVALCLLSAATAPPRALAQQIPGNAQYFKKLHEVRSERQRGLIREFFAGRRDGVFVDVGSAHYRDLSMTFFLERDFGWSGVAIPSGTETLRITENAPAMARFASVNLGMALV